MASRPESRIEEIPSTTGPTPAHRREALDVPRSGMDLELREHGVDGGDVIASWAVALVAVGVIALFVLPLLSS